MLAGVWVTTVRRLALLAVGLLGARCSVLRRMAPAVWESGLGRAEQPSVLRRTLPDQWVEAHRWHWGANQVADLEHQRRLLVAMAWATLLVLCLGRTQAISALATGSASTTSSRKLSPLNPVRGREETWKCSVDTRLPC